MSDEQGSTRMDKWLWAARFFKTRALATRACELGRIEVNGQKAKAAKDVRLNDRLSIRNEAGEFQVQVLGLSGVRGPAAAAQALYVESEASREQRRKQAEERKTLIASGAVPESKPSRRDRSQLDRLRGR